MGQGWQEPWNILRCAFTASNARSLASPLAMHMAA